MNPANQIGGADRQGRHGAFTLVEMLAVIAIMVTLLGMVGVGVSQLTAQSSRKSAVNQVLNSFEQARVAALRYGTNVYVGFANNDSGFEEDKRFRAFVVFRDRLESDNPPASVSTDPVYLTKWKQLPKGVSFKSEAGSVIKDTLSTAEVALPGNATATVPVMRFNQTGMVAEPPPGSGDLTLYLYEGFYDNGTDRVTLKSSSTLYESFSFARFTGRIRHEITALP